MRIRAAVSVLCVTALATGLIYAAPPGQIRVQVNLVNLFATVRDKHKGIVTGLKIDDFQIFEDGQPQEITNFAAESDLPITLGLLIDTSGSEEFMLSIEKEMGTRFLRRVMRKGDLAMVMTFDLDVDLLADFTQDTSVLSSAIRRARVNSVGGGGVVTPGTIPQGSNAGGTDLYDAVYLACHDELATEAGRKGVIILTDAEDTGSKLNLQDAIEAAQRTDTVVHILLVYDPHYGANASVARKITDETGGRMIVVNSEKHLQEAFDQISEELRSQYTLGYYPTNSARDGKFRKIKIDLANHDLKVLARKGYYAPKS